MGYITCPSCKEVNPDNRIICAHCGNMLAADSQPKPAPLPKKKTIFQNRLVNLLLLSLVGSYALGFLVFYLTNDVAYFCSSGYIWLGVVTAVLWIRKLNESEWKFRPKMLWFFRVVFTLLSLVASPLLLILGLLPLQGLLAKAGDRPAYAPVKFARPARPTAPRAPFLTRASLLKAAKYAGLSILLFVVIIALTIFAIPPFIRWSNGLESDNTQRLQARLTATAQAEADHIALRKTARANQVSALVKTWGSAVNQCSPEKVPPVFGGANKITTGTNPARMLLINWSADIEQDVTIHAEQANLPAGWQATSSSDLAWVVCLNQYDKSVDKCPYYQNDYEKKASFVIDRMRNQIDGAIYDPARGEYFAEFQVLGTAPRECAKTAVQPKGGVDRNIYGEKAEFQQVRSVLDRWFLEKN